jgi:hypothetical protein
MLRLGVVSSSFRVGIPGEGKRGAGRLNEISAPLAFLEDDLIRSLTMHCRRDGANKRRRD